MNVTLITGGSDGIGAEMARQLAARHGGGIALVLAGRSRDKLDAVAAQCSALGAQVLTIAMEMAEEAQCRELVARTVATFGRLDTLVNNAGISAQALFEQVSAQDLHWYEDLMKVNLWGSVWCTHAALPHLKSSKGCIVAVSSLAGLMGVPGRTAYIAPKFAMTGFFEALRAELKGAQGSVTLQGAIESLDTAAQTFQLRGSTVEYGANGVQFDGGSASDLANGRAVTVRGNPTAGGTRITARRISFN